MRATLKNLLDRLCAWLHRVMSEDNGNPSSMRVVMVGWHAVVAGVWVWVCIHSGMLVPLDASVVQVLGMTLAAKFGQKFGESKAAAPGVDSAPQACGSPLPPS